MIRLNLLFLLCAVSFAERAERSRYLVVPTAEHTKKMDDDAVKTTEINGLYIPRISLDGTQKLLEFGPNQKPQSINKYSTLTHTQARLLMETAEWTPQEPGDPK